MIQAKLVSVEAWIAANYGEGAPSIKTVRRWIHDGYIFPKPEKHGRAYFVRADARYVDPANPPIDLKSSGRTTDFLERVKASVSAPNAKRGARALRATIRLRRA